MFTGIVEATGAIVATSRSAGGVRLTLDAGSLDLSGVAVGDSIAVDGCCLTVVDWKGTSLVFDASAETLSCTTGLDRMHEVNLERALRFGDRLDGHFVSGHVDGVGAVTRLEKAPGDEGSMLLEVEAPAELGRFIAAKGSIAVNGVSLTTNRVAGSRFSVNLIPHTLAVTTLGHLAIGEGVNLEVDMLARYLERMGRASV
jgi:riboflavin synthase